MLISTILLLQHGNAPKICGGSKKYKAEPSRLITVDSYLNISNDARQQILHMRILSPY